MKVYLVKVGGPAEWMVCAVLTDEARAFEEARVRRDALAARGLVFEPYGDSEQGGWREVGLEHEGVHVEISAHDALGAAA